MTAQDEVMVARAAELLRQEQETFNQQKDQDKRWFRVRLAMGWVAVVTLPLIFGVAATIVWLHESFDPLTVQIATSALLVDALGISASLYRLVLGDQPKRALAPVVTAGVSPAGQAVATDSG